MEENGEAETMWLELGTDSTVKCNPGMAGVGGSAQDDRFEVGPMSLTVAKLWRVMTSISWRGKMLDQVGTWLIFNLDWAFNSGYSNFTSSWDNRCWCHCYSGEVVRFTDCLGKSKLLLWSSPETLRATYSTYSSLNCSVCFWSVFNPRKRFT